MRHHSISSTPANLPWLATLVTALLWLLAAAVSRADAQVKPVYETGFSNITKLAGELHAALDAKKQQAVHREIVLLESVKTPYMGPVAIKEGQVQRTVQVSRGFIHFINSLSHAKALSEGNADVVKAYAARIASTPVPPSVVTDGMAPGKAWRLEVMNVQAGKFHQMAGAMVAIEFAHHYLGHYKKYATRMTPDATGTLPPIGNFVTEREWREAVLSGAKNALDCGLGMDGLTTLFACLEAMPSRPGWRAYFAPAKANLSKLSKEVLRLESDFFLANK